MTKAITGADAIKKSALPKKIEKQGGFYTVGRKNVPDAWRVQEEANEAHIRTEIRECEQNDEYAKVVIRAYSPDGLFVDDVVIHHFPTLLQKIALDYLKKDIARVNNKEKPYYFIDMDKPFTEDGKPLLTANGIVAIMNYMVNRKTFAIRDAASKASRRAQLKILNSEWRENPEIKSELEEVKMVAGDSKVKVANEPPTVPEKPSPAANTSDTKKKGISIEEMDKLISSGKKTGVIPKKTKKKAIDGFEKIESKPEQKTNSKLTDSELIITEKQVETTIKGARKTNDIIDAICIDLDTEGTRITRKLIVERAQELLGQTTITIDQLAQIKDDLGL